MRSVYGMNWIGSDVLADLLRAAMQIPQVRHHLGNDLAVGGAGQGGARRASRGVAAPC